MNINLLNIVKRIIAEQGEDILADPQRLKAFFLDYAKDEPKNERVAFGRCIEMRAYEELKNIGSEDERQRKKETLANQLHAKTSIDKVQCADAIDLLEAAVFGETLAVKTEKNFCKNCGKELLEGWSSCPYCSTQVSEAPVLKQKEDNNFNSAISQVKPNNEKDVLINEKSKINKLLLVAGIFQLCLGFVYVIGTIILLATGEGVDSVLLAFGFSLLFLLQALLILHGRKKNSHNMILAAAILGIFFGIIASILCFIAYSKMHRMNKNKIPEKELRA